MWQRYVAVGDSFTEGIGDIGPDGVPRGWADRFAEELAVRNPDLQYANLAVRGRRMRSIVAEQLPAALRAEPDLISLVGGVNDVLRPTWSLLAVSDALEGGVAEARRSGADVLLITYGEPDRNSRLLRRVRQRLADYRDEVLRISEQYDCLLLDLWHVNNFHDARFWSPDRLHLNSLGHQRMSWAAMEAVGLSAPDWQQSLPEEDSAALVGRVASNLVWTGNHFLPWVGRRLLGRSSGDGVRAKRPNLEPIFSPAQQSQVAEQ